MERFEVRPRGAAVHVPGPRRNRGDQQPATPTRAAIRATRRLNPFGLMPSPLASSSNAAPGPIGCNAPTHRIGRPGAGSAADLSRPARRTPRPARRRSPSARRAPTPPTISRLAGSSQVDHREVALGGEHAQVVTAAVDPARRRGSGPGPGRAGRGAGRSRRPGAAGRRSPVPARRRAAAGAAGAPGTAPCRGARPPAPGLGDRAAGRGTGRRRRSRPGPRPAPAARRAAGPEPPAGPPRTRPRRAGQPLLEERRAVGQPGHQRPGRHRAPGSRSSDRAVEPLQ